MNLDELPSGPFLVDNMRDEASRAYGAHPERLYIILDGRIVYQVKFLYIINNKLIFPLSGWCWTLEL